MVAWKRIRYRVDQFFHTLYASLTSADRAYADRHLSPTLRRLFARLSRAEQHHAIDVARALEAQGHHDPDLLAAALLHDVGKTVMTPYLWERVIVVLGEHYLPRLAERWSAGEPRGLRRGFVIRSHHAAWGAELAQEAGAAPRTVELIRRHHHPPGDDEELALLQDIDG